MNLLDLITVIESSDTLSNADKEKFVKVLKELIEKEKDWEKVKTEYLDRKLQKGGRGSYKTVHNLKRYIGIFERFFEEKYGKKPSFILIDDKVMISFIAWMKQQRKWKKGDPWSLNYIHKIYMSVVDFLSFAGVQDVYRLRSEAPPTEDKEYIDTYTDEEVRTILSLFTRDNFEEFRDRINFLLKVVTGARTSEIDNLTWDDIDFTEHKFRTVMKGGIEAKKYIPEPVWSELMEYKKEWQWWVGHHQFKGGKPTNRLFFKITSSGEIAEVSDRFFYRRLKIKVERYNKNRGPGEPYLDPKKVNNKKFRSYLISLFYDIAESYEKAALLVDHLDPKTTRKYYVKIERERKEDLYEKLIPELRRRKILDR